MSLPLSVVIPTRHRPTQLAATLDALAAQRLRGRAPGEGFEVVVVDDGSDPPAQQAVSAVNGRGRRPLNCRWLRQERLGPAAARNRGIEASGGERILLLGDDTRPADPARPGTDETPGTLQSHLDAAAVYDPSGNVGVQGHIDWDPHRTVTPLMEFLAPAGPQFYFVGLRPGREIPYSAVLGSNYSAPRRWFIDEPFDTSFPAAALEDTELAYRFRGRGWRSIYAPQALCWHDHLYDDLNVFLQRQRRAGRAARYAVRRHPALLPKLLLQPLGMAPWSMWRWLRAPRGSETRRHRGWDLRCRTAFSRGFFGF